VCRWIRVGEAADLAFLIVPEPADTVLRCMAINKWAVLVRHLATMAHLENAKSLFLAVTSADIHPP